MRTLLLFLAFTLFFLLFFVQAQASGLVIGLSNETSGSTTRLFFSPGGTPGFDNNLDKEMHGLPANSMNYIYSVDGKKRLYVNYCPNPEAYYSVSLQVAVAETGMFTLLPEYIDGEMTGVRFSLTDAATGITTPLLPGAGKQVEFTRHDLDKKKDFILHIFPAPVTSGSPVGCYGGKNGAVRASFACKGEWETRLHNGVAQLTSTSVTTESVEFAGLPSGVYIVEGWKNKVRIWEEFVVVGHPAPLAARFSLSADTIVAGQSLFLTNTSKGAQQWYWRFGDRTTSASYSPGHRYKAQGSYDVSLTVSDGAGCTSTAQKTVHVVPGIPVNVTAGQHSFAPPVTEAAPGKSGWFVSTNEKKITVKQPGVPSNSMIGIYDMSGKLVRMQYGAEPMYEFECPQAGVYVVRIIDTAAGNGFSQKVVVNE